MYLVELLRRFEKLNEDQRALLIDILVQKSENIQAGRDIESQAETLGKGLFSGPAAEEPVVQKCAVCGK